MKNILSFLLIICLCGCSSEQSTTYTPNPTNTSADEEKSDLSSTYDEYFGDKHREKKEKGLQEAKNIEVPEGQYLVNCPLDVCMTFSEDDTIYTNILFFVDKERFKKVSYAEYCSFIDSKKANEAVSDSTFSTIVFGDGTGIRFDKQVEGYGTYGILDDNNGVEKGIISVFSERDYNNLLSLIDQDPHELPEQQVAEEQVQENIVYVGVSGSKYHTKNCKTLKGNGRELSFDDAIRQGYTACKVCR